MMMKKTMALGLGASLLAVAVTLPVGLIRAQGVGQRAGQAIDNAGRGIRRGVQGAFTRTRAAVHDQEVIARVYSRIHWDKTLVGSALELEMQDGGTAILRGAVPDEAAKQRAVVLARDTVGVTLVVDELTVLPPAARVIPAPPPTPTGTTTTIITTP